MQNNHKIICDQIKEARLAKEWTIYRLFCECGIIPPCLMAFEDGTRMPSERHCLSLSKVLGIEIKVNKFVRESERNE